MAAHATVPPQQIMKQKNHIIPSPIKDPRMQLAHLRKPSQVDSAKVSPPPEFRFQCSSTKYVPIEGSAHGLQRHFILRFDRASFFSDWDEILEVMRSGFYSMTMMMMMTTEWMKGGETEQGDGCK